MPGVVGFVDHNDIPGENNIQAFAMFGATAPKKELFSSGKITHVGQVIGAICADTPEQANRAAKLVE
jgi:xanthine dehydrogenase molybdopterin-binding subunit B